MEVPGPDSAFKVFGDHDSCCLSYGVKLGSDRFFVKLAQTTDAVESLCRAAEFHTAISHEAIVAPVDVTMADGVSRLVYPWIGGFVLNQSTVTGSDKSGLARFQGLPVAEIESALDLILDAHLSVVNAGFVAVDLYDGCFLYDFDTATMRLIDLDEYRPGPFRVEADRLPGSTRYMAPEEFISAATIDERTTVFNLGRTMHILLDSPTGWRGSDVQRFVIERATVEDPARRFEGVNELLDAWN